MSADFAVPRWFKSPHLQTLGAAFPLFAPPRSHAGLDAEDLRIPLDDAHSLHAKAWWATGEGPRPGLDSGRPPSAPRPVALVVHGIGGSSASRYVVRAAVALHRAGYHVVRLDLRGAGASVPDVPSLYHAGLSSDLDVAAAHLARDPRVSGVVLFGFSGGGSLALKLAGEWGGGAPAHVRAIVSVSAPLDYTKVAPWMDALGRLPYRFHVLRGLTTGARAFARTHPHRAHYRPMDVKRMSSFRHYDASVIVPMHGFSDVDAYYAAACAGPLLSRIEVPTLLVHAVDDPMVPGWTVLPWIGSASRAVEPALTPHGGHIGWVSGFDEASWIQGWAMRRALAFLDRVLA